MSGTDGGHWHQRGQPVTPPIPLQDLSSNDRHDAAADAYTRATPQTHRRSPSSILSRSPEPHYSQLHPNRENPLGLQIHGGPAESPIFSPVGPAFQDALGFAGATTSSDYLHDTSTLYPTRRHSRDRRSPWSLPGGEDSQESLPPEEFADGTGAFPSDRDGDSVPLFETSRPRVSESHSPRTTPSSHKNDRNQRSQTSNRFLSPSLAHSSFDPEQGLGPRQSSPSQHRSSTSRPRSNTHHGPPPISLGQSPLRRATTIMRKMSQRVVNLTNQAEVVEHSIRRSNSYNDNDRPPPPPSLVDLSVDGATSSQLPRDHEQPQPPPVAEKVDSINARINPMGDSNPMRGNSWGIFPPHSPIRKALLELLVHPWIEPFILLLIVLQTALLTVDASTNLDLQQDQRWGHFWVDYAMLALFSIYTVELIFRTIVSGFFVNPIEYSSINREMGVRKAVMLKANDLFALHRRHSFNQQQNPTLPPPNPTMLRSLTGQVFPGFDLDPQQAQRVRLAHRAFLRHSFNRLDFVAVIAYWIGFALDVTGWQNDRHIYVFRMLACLRIVKLLGLTPGTSIILRSLKRAMPILLNVAFLIGFFWLLFAIIGMQSFKSSLRRYCVWGEPDGTGLDTQFAQNETGSFQFCGGWLADNGTSMPYLRPDGQFGASTAKGYFCPVGSRCLELENPYNGTVSFDNLVQSLELVFVIMTTNTFTDIMYNLTMSDYLPAALYFACGIIIMTFWLVNLLIAVITSSFQIIREESKVSAFAAAEKEDNVDIADALEPDLARETRLQRVFYKTQSIWLIIIAFGLIVSCLRSDTMSSQRAGFVDRAELAVTIALDIEIVLRFIVDWRGFFKGSQNLVDLTLAVVTTVIQIPIIHDSGRPYAWLTILQVARIYRVVLAVRVTRELIVLVLGNFFGLANLILFVFLLTFLAALFAVQLFRGDIPAIDDFGNDIEVTFFNIWNAFLGMYQMLSSENWTSILYTVTAFETQWNTAWIGASFCILWYILANFIVLNMFIAVIQENFDVSEDEKRVQQVKAYLQHQQFVSQGAGPLSLSAIFKFGRVRRQDPLDFGHQTGMLAHDQVVDDFLAEPEDLRSPTRAPTMQPQSAGLHTRPGSMLMYPLRPGFFRLDWWKRLRRAVWDTESNPFYGRIKLSGASHDLDPRQMAKEVVQAQNKRKLEQRRYLVEHPMYNVSLFIFKQNNPIRKMCQRVVGPGRGIEIERLEPSRPIYYSFSAFIYAAIIAMVLLACVTTPLYQKEYFAVHGYTRRNWFVMTDLGFAALFTVEALIKVIADGFFWTPNAYLRNSWGFIDFVVLVTLWADVITVLLNPSGGSRAVGAFKALRALRLLNVSDSTRDTFHSVVVLGGWKVVSAAFVNVSLLIPFAIYGLNLFNGRMQSCNDGTSSTLYTPSGGIFNLTDCVNEYTSSPFQWDVLAPRRVDNSYYSFDDFGSSIFILFQIVSQEGWTEVMWSAQSITGHFTQPSPFASQGNAVYFVIFNLLGAVFVLTLFVSVFMRNYTEQTGVAFLTTEQRSWLELRKLLRQVSPSKRPSPKELRENWHEWCYKRAIQKNGWWQRGVTVLLTLHLVLLCLEWYPDPTAWLRVRDFMFLILTLFYMVNIGVRIIGLSWARFRHSAWDIYSLLCVSGTFVTTLALVTNFNSDDYVKAHKLFLVSVALLLIPRNNQLDQLFKTAAASLTAIANLLATWFVLFLVFAIACTQTFGLTRFHSDNQDANVNFRTVPKALVLLFRTSVGEGWNEIMWDFASVNPPYCTIGEQYYEGDCGSRGWAAALFVAWNILSMYIFINLFVSLIYESFSYVYQRSSGLSAISREEIRRFKQAWAEYDPSGSGYISREAFPRLLGELSGVFEMRIYDGDFTVRNIIDDCQPRRAAPLAFDGVGSTEIKLDLKKLNKRLAELPVAEIRRRRKRMNTFYEEVLVSADPDRGIEFSALLMILAHYKVINDNKSLRLEEFLRRRARMKRVDEAVKRNIVLGFFDAMYQVRKLRKALEERRRERGLVAHVPEILVHDDPSDAADLNAPPVTLYSPLTPTEGGYSSLSETLTADGPPSTVITRPSGFGALIEGASGPGSEGPTSRYRSDSIQMSPSPNEYTDRRRQQSPGQTSRTSADGGLDVHTPTMGGGGGRVSSDLRPWGTLDSGLHAPRVRHSSDHQRDGAADETDTTRGRATSNALSVNEFIESEALSSSVWGESIRRASSIRRVSSVLGRGRGPSPSSTSASTSTGAAVGGRRSASATRRPSAGHRRMS